MNLPDREDETLDETVAAEQLKILARRKKLVAMANITLAMTTKGTMTLVYDA